MSIKDKHGKEVTEGSYIIYTKTGTIGEVLDTRVDENGSWALIQRGELDRLWYNSQYIEITDTKPKLKLNDEDNKKLSEDELKEVVNTVRDSEMSEDAVGGG